MLFLFCNNAANVEIKSINSHPTKFGYLCWLFTFLSPNIKHWPTAKDSGLGLGLGLWLRLGARGQGLGVREHWDQA